MSNQFLITNNGISGSLTHLADGQTYLVSGQNISILSQSNGQIFISAEILNINSVSGSLGFYTKSPIPQQSRVGQLDVMTNLVDTTPTSTWVNSNFNLVQTKIGELIAKVNSLESKLSQEAGGIGITE